MTILVTGSNGFVGSALCRRLKQEGFPVRGALRSIDGELCGFESIKIGDITGETDWTEALTSVRSIVHLAARVHVMADQSANSLTYFRRTNVQGTINLARQAAVAGVKRFVFISSIKVNGESTQLGHPFTVDDEPMPEDSYAISKHEAELMLKKIVEQTDMEVVIIRSPLVYGPSVKANFKIMMRWIAQGIPLPLGAATYNRRSFLALDNLVDIIVTCLSHPAAANQTFFASDGEDLSTVELLRRLGQALGKPVHLFHIPSDLLKLGAAIINKQGVHQRLFGTLQADISKTRKLLNWSPPLSVGEGLHQAIQGFHQ